MNVRTGAGTRAWTAVRRALASRGFRPWLSAGAVAAMAAIVVVAALLAVPEPETREGAPPPGFGDRRSAGGTDGGDGGPGDDGGAPPGRSRDAPDGIARAEPDRRASAVTPPVRLRIPRLRVDAEVQPVGLARDGTVAVPGDAAGTGWYRYGPAPGAPAGSAVLVGHVDSRTGRLGALAALHDVRAGDAVIVRRKGAPAVRYTVASQEVRDRDRLPGELFRRNGPPVLTLITCTLPYDREQGGYRNNLIVTATRVSG
ncbi:class F sortase [Streptomyces sp. WAC 00631]|uniref:class F sortase n=1 Tax=Streptomyces sp. WAC 00631 TaxID=2203201 RepID=UPI000F78381C|nr:class F sortase [Streptomyces sp. WAC 00631]MCC5032496.1 class F sortase [Streptomyces sp. WAC 00631]